MSTKITRTFYGSELQAAQFPGVPWAMRANTTLNEKFNVLAGVAPSTLPKAKYFAIGRGGHQSATGVDGSTLIDGVPHVADHASCYLPFPFILRAINNDIDNTTQQKYALRQQVTINGVQYYAYWLKRLDLSAAVVSTAINTIANGAVTNTANFNPQSSVLSPVPPVVNSAGANTLVNQIGVTSMTAPIAFTQAECTELLNAATIMYGDPAYAIVSEIAVVSGVDYPITLPSGSTFNEVIAAQVCTHITTFHMVSASANGFSGSYNLGTAEPLLSLNTGS